MLIERHGADRLASRSRGVAVLGVLQWKILKQVSGCTVADASSWPAGDSASCGMSCGALPPSYRSPGISQYRSA